MVEVLKLLVVSVPTVALMILSAIQRYQNQPCTAANIKEFFNSIAKSFMPLIVHGFKNVPAVSAIVHSGLVASVQFAAEKWLGHFYIVGYFCCQFNWGMSKETLQNINSSYVMDKLSNMFVQSEMNYGAAEYFAWILCEIHNSFIGKFSTARRLEYVSGDLSIGYEQDPEIPDSQEPVPQLLEPFDDTTTQRVTSLEDKQPPSHEYVVPYIRPHNQSSSRSSYRNGDWDRFTAYNPGAP
jgi:hypothetical protein